jgi:KDO2-lipid IV(A) lauroyltransferase
MARRGELRNRLEYALVRSLTGSLGLLPRPVSIWAARMLGRAACAALGRLRRIAERNLLIAFPEISEQERRKILIGSFDHLGRQLGEFAYLRRATAASLGKIAEYDAESLRRLEAAQEPGKGTIFVTAHLGGWEILALAHSALYGPLSILARPIENPRIDRFVHECRSRFGNVIVDKKSAGLTCMRILRKGGTLGILADLNSLPQEGVFVPFFGKLACTTLAVAALALPSNATVFPVFAPWNPALRKYVFQGGPAIEMLRTGDHERDLGANTARVTAVIERVIRQYPDQWLWIHDRWHALLRPGDRVCEELPQLQ